MTPVRTGIVLPESVLTSSWFSVLALIVAFNTIIYLGLTVSKLIPWPHQFHPSRVRGWLARLGRNVDLDPLSTQVPVAKRPESTDPYEVLRGSVARRDIPQAFGLFGLIVIMLSVASFFTSRNVGVVIHLLQLGMGVALLLLASITGRRHFRSRTIMWLWVSANTVLVVGLLVEAGILGSQFPLAYALIAMTAYAPITLAWRPALVGAAIMFTALVAGALFVTGNEDIRLILAGLGALLTGGALLRVRLVALDALADERARSAALATTDPLTGVLTRNGLLTLVPHVAGTAERTGQAVCVMFVDIDDLDRANEAYGMIYGDDVVRAVARALSENVRLGDLVARWDGDDFVAVGIGNTPDPVALAARLQAAVGATGVDLGKWPVSIRVGTSSGDPRDRTFAELLAAASGPLAD